MPDKNHDHTDGLTKFRDSDPEQPTVATLNEVSASTTPNKAV